MYQLLFVLRPQRSGRSVTLHRWSCPSAISVRNHLDVIAADLEDIDLSAKVEQLHPLALQLDSLTEAKDQHLAAIASKLTEMRDTAIRVDEEE